MSVYYVVCQIQKNFEQKQQQELIASQEKMKQTELNWKAEQAELERINDLEEKRIAALGYGNSTSAEIEQSIIDLQKLRLQEADMERLRANDDFNNKLKEAQFNHQADTTQKKVVSDEAIKLMELDLRKKELEEARARTAIMAKKKN